MSGERKWADLLPKEAVETALRLARRVREEQERGEPVLPPADKLFQTLELTPPSSVKAVIVGQDVYPTPGYGHGLAFSVEPDVESLPRSLKNIFLEYEADLGKPAPANGYLAPWAKQGVLLLNTSLSVYAGRPGSCMDWGWQDFVGAVLEVCANLPQPVVFLAWGRYAQNIIAKYVPADSPRKFVLKSSHPSPLGCRKASAGVPAFLGSRPFSRTNELLVQAGGDPILW